MAGYCELFSNAWSIIATLDAVSWSLDGQYCVHPTCRCPDVGPNLLKPAGLFF
jgi:hypothetical protein